MHLTWPALESERVLLRKLTKFDADDVYSYWSNPDVSRYLTSVPHRGLGDTRDFIDDVVARYTRGDVAPWAVVLKETSAVIGTCGFLSHDVNNRCAEMSFALAHEYWGQGLMTEAVRLVIDFGFARMKLNRLEGRAHENNVAAITLMEKAGMTIEGVLRDCAVVQNQAVSMVVCSVVRGDREPMKHARVRVLKDAGLIKGDPRRDDAIDGFLATTYED